MNWICSQIGARENYAIPRALKASGRLETLFTEFWAGPAVRQAARWIPVGGLRLLAGRWHPGLEQNAETLKTEKLKSGVSISAFPLSAFTGQVVSWNFSTVLRQVTLRIKSEIGNRKSRTPHPGPLPIVPQRGEGGVYAHFIRDGKWFSETVRDHLARRNADLRGTVVFSYDTTALELFQWAKERGAFCVLGQMDPNRVEMKLVQAEEKRWPGWANQNAEMLKAEILKSEGGKENAEMLKPETLKAEILKSEGGKENAEMLKPETLKAEILKSEGGKEESGRQRAEIENAETLESGKRKAESGNGGLEEYFQRREAEWKLADRVIVNSRWSFDALVAQGVPPEKLVVIPLCYEARSQKSEVRSQKSDFGTLRVLFLGQVILRKGVQYLVEAAKLLQDEPVHFDVVGPTGISVDAMKSAPANVTFHGRVNRDEAGGWYRRADVFVLPTISDGFALTQIEAMAHGLPVIATPNCGEVVTDGADGFIVPARDAVALAKAIRRYLAEPELLGRHGVAALNKSKLFTLDKLAGRLITLEDELAEKAEKLKH